MESAACNLCTCDDKRLRYQVAVDDTSLRFFRFARHAPSFAGTYHIVECLRCGLMYVDPRLDDEQLAQVYADNAILGGKWRGFWQYLFRANQPDDLQDLAASGNAPANGQVSSSVQWRFDRLRQHGVGPAASILDVGCGRGEFLHAAVERGHDAVGVDASADRVRYARETLQLGDRVVHGTAADVVAHAKGRKFDAITLWDLIEHVPDPVGVLQSLRPLCHENTRIFVQTMSTDSWTYKLFGKRWYYINPPIHLFYFSNTTMMKALEVAGFGLLDIANDNSRPATPLRLVRSLLQGLGNQLMFKIYGPHASRWKALKPLLRPWQGSISDERMERRLENLYPGFYAGRMRDCFVYVARPCGSWIKQTTGDTAPRDRRAPARSLR